MTSTEFVRDPQHWLLRLSPAEWLHASVHQLLRAKQADAANERRAALRSFQRACGMALNAALIVEPNAAWGDGPREQLSALGRETDVPEAVRAAARCLLAGATNSAPVLVVLRRPSQDSALANAAETVIAHAYAVVNGSTRSRSA